MNLSSVVVLATIEGVAGDSSLGHSCAESPSGAVHADQVRGAAAVQELQRVRQPLLRPASAVLGEEERALPGDVPGRDAHARAERSSLRNDHDTVRGFSPSPTWLSALRLSYPMRPWQLTALSADALSQRTRALHAGARKRRCSSSCRRRRARWWCSDARRSSARSHATSPTTCKCSPRSTYAYVQVLYLHSARTREHCQMPRCCVYFFPYL